MALHYALNGFLVHLIDFEGWGYSGGKRFAGLRVENMHRNMTSLLMQVRSDLPLFLFGHSMGGMCLQTYLSLNKAIADRIAGAIYSAPFMGIPDFVNFDAGKKAIVKFLSPHLDEMLLTSGMPTHMVCKNRTYMRLALTGKKAAPFSSLGLQASFLRMLDLIHGTAKQVTHPYLLVMADKDIIVNNNSSKEWHR